MSKAAVYAIREYTRLDNLTEAELKRIQGDFPVNSYVCILVQRIVTNTEAEAHQIVVNNPVFVSAAGNQYAQGGIKGQPPGSTNPLH